MQEQTWRAQAACADLDPDLFFPAGETGPALEQIDAAKAVCAICPVQSPCLEFALSTREKQGIWGGYTEDERRKILRQRRKSA